jgi:Zn-dependent M28 family amino/carboxypeptidase
MARSWFLLLVVALAACGEGKREDVASVPDTALSQLERVEADLHRHTRVLASDEFGGRAPGTPHEVMTVEYLRDAFAELGLQPGNQGSWYQQVPITAVTTSPETVLNISHGDGGLALEYGSQMMAATQQQVPRVDVVDSPLVFVGYGIVAPERGWNDYADVDVTGKTVVMLVNDPGYATQDPALFNGNTMTYYGRWTYKYEEAARQGAAAAVIIHETGAAAYPWEVVENSWSGPNIGLTAEDRNEGLLKIESWVTQPAARELFELAGLNFDASVEAAARPGFRAREMGTLRASISLDNMLESSLSRNVLARLPGSEAPGEHIVYSSHWDHLGTRGGEGDTIFNGASDNASGVAGLLAIARQFGQLAQPPRRSVLFLAVTAEESGLLGSRWYGENPVFPLETTVANINMDNLYKAVDGRTRDVAVVGLGNSTLEDYLAAEARGQDRVVVQEPNPEKGFYYRSDHFNFARQGVPALYLTRSADSRERGAEWGQEQLATYTAIDYHKPSDEYSPDWDLSGTAEDVLLLYGVGRQLATGRDWPEWRSGVEFRAKRELSRASRAE